MLRSALIVSTLLAGDAALGKIVTQAVEYKHGDVTLEGYLAYDDAKTGKRPGVLIIHEWWGLNDYARKRAEQLAGLGYVAFAADMYGKGVVTTDREKARELSGQFYGKPLMRERAAAGLDVLARDPRVDPKRIAAIGYCFGGTTVLQLALGGADLAGVVSFHGGLAPPLGEASGVKARVLICHGADDPFVPADQIAQFQETLRKAGADWQMIYYARAVHSFTNPRADDAKIDGSKYNADADRRSWQHMRDFFAEIFSESTTHP
jgi:dienelactone hydrolase